ncbi:MAG: glycosyltransferase family 39 protein [Deltaproteobacteria bacterium]|nr:glycosyltransferase family 39 protein [Deltaproteobacteria bacterium]
MNTKGFYGICILILYLFILGVAVYIIDYYPKPAIEGALMIWMPWTLRLNFIMLCAGLLFWWLNRRNTHGRREEDTSQSSNTLEHTNNHGKDLFRSNQVMDLFINNRTGVSLALILVAAFSAVYFLSPQIHRLFYDEDIYTNIGQNIAYLNRAAMCNYGIFDYGDYQGNWMEYNKDPNGWPFLVSLVFQAFGVNEAYVFLLNNLIFTGSVFIVYLIVRRLTDRFFPALLGALVYAIIPHNLIWSNTAVAEPAAAFFGGLTALFLVSYLRSQKEIHFYLFALTLPLACQMRPESGLIAIWAAITILVLSPKTLLKRHVWALGSLSVLFLMPHVFHLYAMSGHSWGAEGAKFSTDFFLSNLRVNGPYYLNNEQFPVMITILTLMGCLVGKGIRRWMAVILAWLVLFWGIFLFFYAGSYRFGTDVRFALVTFMPMAILAGLGGGVFMEWFVKKRYAGALIVLVLLFSWLSFLPMIRTVGQEAWAARFDHWYAREFAKKIPNRSIVLTHNPSMFLLWGQSAIQSHVGLKDPELVRQLMDRYPGQVYFHFNFWCNTERDPNRKLCEEVMAAYSMEEIATAQEQHYHYGLYRMHPKKSGKAEQ